MSSPPPPISRDVVSSFSVQPCRRLLLLRSTMSPSPISPINHVSVSSFSDQPCRRLLFLRLTMSPSPPSPINQVAVSSFSDQLCRLLLILRSTMSPSLVSPITMSMSPPPPINDTKMVFSSDFDTSSSNITAFCSALDITNEAETAVPQTVKKRRPPLKKLWQEERG